MNVTVLGAGNWGTTSALLLHGNGHAVRLWEFNPDIAWDIKTLRENKLYLKGFHIPPEILVTSSLEEALSDTEIAVFVVPSVYMRETAKKIGQLGCLPKDTILVSLAKGLEHGTLRTMTDLIGEELPGLPTVALSGPCIAPEVAQKLPTTVVSASEDQFAAEKVQDVFMAPYFRVYTSNDPKGVQLGGALKNIIAIAAGINDGLGYGYNAKSALITRGIVEMQRLGEILGAKPETFNGLSGIGDLITTCYSPKSRNRSLGEELGKGVKLMEILKKMVMVAEGVVTSKNVYEYTSIMKIDMPITKKVYDILFNDADPSKAVNDLMLRDKKSE